jgi:hypothetical protein
MSLFNAVELPRMCDVDASRDCLIWFGILFDMMVQSP